MTPERRNSEVGEAPQNLTARSLGTPTLGFLHAVTSSDTITQLGNLNALELT
jgi:hypothetical protein